MSNNHTIEKKPAKNLNYMNFIKVTEKISFFFYGVLVIEIILGNSGRWFAIGAISFRMVIFALCLLFSIPSLIKMFKLLYKERFIWLIIIFALWLIVCTYIGLKLGNNPSYIFSDISGFLILSLSPTVIMFILNEKRAKITELITNFIIYSSFCLAIFVAIIHFLIPFLSITQISTINSLLNVTSFGGLAILSGNIYRIYLRSELYFQIALVILIVKQLNADKFNRNEIIVTAVIAFASLLSFTRSFWVGMFVSLLFVLLVFRNSVLKIVRLSIYCFAVFIFILGVSLAVYKGTSVVLVGFNRIIITVAPVETFPVDTGENSLYQSDTLRSDVVMLLQKNILKSPFIGNGLGKSLEKFRTEGKTEYFYYDLTMKTGIVGLILFLLQFFYLFRSYLVNSKKNRKLKLKRISHGYVAALAGVMVTSIFNPFLNNPIGLMFVLSVIMIIIEENILFNSVNAN